MSRITFYCTSTPDPEPNSSFSVLSFNANDLRNKLNELHVISSVQNPDVICITETFGSSRYTDTFFHLPNYSMFRQDRLCHGGGGIIIYVCDQLSCQVISSVAHPSGLWEAMTCRIVSQNQSIIPVQITCMYRTPSGMTQTSLKDFIEYFSSSSKLCTDIHTIVLGDFNFPQINWELNLCHHSGDSPENQFLSTMNDNHLSQIVNFPTRFRAGQRPSLLDLVLLHDELLVQSLDTLPAIGKSDHIILSIILTIPIQLKVNKNLRFNFHKADFTLIDSIIGSINWEEEFRNLHCEEALEILHCFLLTICHNLVPQSKPSNSTTSRAPWMNRDIKTLINKKNRLWDKYKLSPSPSNLQNYKQLRNSLTLTIRQKKS